MLAEQEVTFEILASFDYPEALIPPLAGSTRAGMWSGHFVNGLTQTQGFVRFADGTFSDPIVYPTAQSTTSQTSTTLEQCAAVILWRWHISRILLSGSTFTNFDLHAPNTYLRGVNDAGNFCRNYNRPSFRQHRRNPNHVCYSEASDNQTPTG